METSNLGKADCLLLLVREALPPAPHTLGNVPWDGAGVDIKLWVCVPVQASLPAVTTSMGLKKAYIVNNLKETPYLLEGGIQPVYSA